jgi:hypothetical protein
MRHDWKLLFAIIGSNNKESVVWECTRCGTYCYGMNQELGFHKDNNPKEEGDCDLSLVDKVMTS